jgi:hypothetical protein
VLTGTATVAEWQFSPNIYTGICEKPEFHTSEIEILWLEVIYQEQDLVCL